MINAMIPMTTVRQAILVMKLAIVSGSFIRVIAKLSGSFISLIAKLRGIVSSFNSLNIV